MPISTRAKTTLATAAAAALIIIVVLALREPPSSTQPPTSGGAAVPVQQERVISLYYYNRPRDLELSGGQVGCDPGAVLPVERRIRATPLAASDAISVLIKGELTADERARGFETEYPRDGFRLLRADLAEDGVLTLTFSEVPGFTTGGACRIGLLRAGIEKTARQFPEVREVRLMPPEVFQP